MVWAMSPSPQLELPGECMPHTQSHEAQRGFVEISVPAEAPLAVFYAPWDVLSEEHLDFPSVCLCPRQLSRCSDGKVSAA